MAEQKSETSPSTERGTAREEKTRQRQRTVYGFNPIPAYAVSLVAGIAIALVYGLQSFYPDLIGSFSNILTPLSASGAFVSSLLCSRKYGYKLLSHYFDRIWFLFTVSMMLSALGEFTWASYYFSNVSVPYPSIADVFYLGSYAPLIFAQALYFRAFSSVLTKKRLAISLAVIITCGIIVFQLVLPTEFAGNPSVLTVIDDQIYLIMDMALLSLTILSLAIFSGGTMARWWTILAAGFALDIIGDEVFFYQNAQGTYYNGSLSDALYVFAYLFLALAFYIHRKQV
jgi:hypothetical protein